jgi:hypothetical protein
MVPLSRLMPGPFEDLDLLIADNLMRAAERGGLKAYYLPEWFMIWAGTKVSKGVGVKRGHVITFVVNSLKGIFWSPPDVLNSETYRLTATGVKK